MDTGFIYLDRLLIWCAAAKIYVIPDMHDVPGGKLGWVKGNIYGDPQKQALLAHVWRRIAGRYKDNPWVGGYDLVNEPAVWDAPKLGALYKTLIGAVRAVDTHHMVIVEGDAWGSRLDLLGLAGPGDVWDDNLALSLHVYGSALSPSPMAGPERLAAGLDVPLWMGEFGYNSNTWNRALRDQAEAGGVGWCLWAYKSVRHLVPDRLHPPAVLSAAPGLLEPEEARPERDQARARSSMASLEGTGAGDGPEPLHRPQGRTGRTDAPRFCDARRPLPGRADDPRTHPGS